MNKTTNEKLKIGDICCFKSKIINETIQGEIISIEDCKYSKVLNGKECYEKYKNKKLSKKDFVLEDIIHKNNIITIYGWIINDNWSIKETLGEIKFSCSNFDIFVY